MAELSAWDMIGRLLLAAALGAAIGTEREIHGQDAGLRTHLMLALGAALFGVISVGAWDDFFAPTADTNYRIDVTRVASYVAAGIGFIGGGAIVKHAGGVRGLTTAASLWVAAAVGLAAGVGFWVPALTATAVALFSLVALRPVRSVVRRVGTGRGGNLVLTVRDEKVLAELMRVLHEDLPVTPVQVRSGPAANGEGYEVFVVYPAVEPHVLIDVASRVRGLDFVTELHVGAG